MFGLNFLNIYSPLGLLATAFWIWMIYDCAKNEPERYWLYIIIFLNFPGALV
jgi:hypothetical protein